MEQQLSLSQLVVATVLSVVVLFQIYDYTRIYYKNSVEYEKYNLIAYSEQCFDSIISKTPGMNLRIGTLIVEDLEATCTEALMKVHEGVWGPTFYEWGTTRHLYQAVTMRTYESMIFAFGVIVAFMYFFTKGYTENYRTDKLCLPSVQMVRMIQDNQIDYRRRKKNKPPRIEEMHDSPFFKPLLKSPK